MKKRIFAVCAVMVLIAISIVPIFADEYGETPYDVITSWTEYEANERPNPVEQKNPYTLVINVGQTSSIDYWFNINQTDSQNNPVNIAIHIEYGTIWINEGQPNEQTVSTGIMLIPFYWIDTSPWDIFNDTSEGYVLNNQQFVTMKNYTATEAEVDQAFTDGVQSGIQEGLTQGRQEGFELGFDAGYESANEDNEFGNAGTQLIVTAVETPFNVLSQWLDFEVLGVNLLGILMSVLTIIIVVAVIKAIL